MSSTQSQQPLKPTLIKIWSTTKLWHHCSLWRPWNSKNFLFTSLTLKIIYLAFFNVICCWDRPISLGTLPLNNFWLQCFSKSTTVRAQSDYYFQYCVFLYPPYLASAYYQRRQFQTASYEPFPSMPQVVINLRKLNFLGLGLTRYIIWVAESRPAPT